MPVPFGKPAPRTWGHTRAQCLPWPGSLLVQPLPVTLCPTPPKSPTAPWTPPKGQSAREGADHSLGLRGKLVGQTTGGVALAPWPGCRLFLPCPPTPTSGSHPALSLAGMHRPSQWALQGPQTPTPQKSLIFLTLANTGDTKGWPRAEEARGLLGHSPAPPNPGLLRGHRSSAGRVPGCRGPGQPHPTGLAQPLAHRPKRQQASALSQELL